MFGASMLPGGLEFILELERDVGDDQLLFRAECKKAKTIIIDFAHAMLTKGSLS